jgi:lipopolysaccharide export LptBFGC system permease protein LptF
MILFALFIFILSLPFCVFLLLPFSFVAAKINILRKLKAGTKVDLVHSEETWDVYYS